MKLFQESQGPPIIPEPRFENLLFFLLLRCHFHLSCHCLRISTTYKTENIHNYGIADLILVSHKSISQVKKSIYYQLAKSDQFPNTDNGMLIKALYVLNSI